MYLSNDSPDDKLSNGTSFIAIVILEVLENIFKICPFKRTNSNSVGLGGLMATWKTNIQNHEVFQNHPCALQIVAYYDELELCNALGLYVNK